MLLTYWCFDHYGLLPETMLSRSAIFAFDILPPFFHACFVAWAALGGGSSSAGDLTISSAASGGPLQVASLSSKSCYKLLLDLHRQRPHCAENVFLCFGPWENCTWRSPHFMPPDKNVIDLNWKVAHGVVYTAEFLASFGCQFQLACFCGAQPKNLVQLLFCCALAQSSISRIQ